MSNTTTKFIWMKYIAFMKSLLIGNIFNAKNWNHLRVFFFNGCFAKKDWNVWVRYITFSYTQQYGFGIFFFININLVFFDIFKSHFYMMFNLDFDKFDHIRIVIKLKSHEKQNFSRNPKRSINQCSIVLHCGPDRLFSVTLSYNTVPL